MSYDAGEIPMGASRDCCTDQSAEGDEGKDRGGLRKMGKMEMEGRSLSREKEEADFRASQTRSVVAPTRQAFQEGPGKGKLFKAQQARRPAKAREFGGLLPVIPDTPGNPRNFRPPAPQRSQTIVRPEPIQSGAMVTMWGWGAAGATPEKLVAPLSPNRRLPTDKIQWPPIRRFIHGHQRCWLMTNRKAIFG